MWEKGVEGNVEVERRKREVGGRRAVGEEKRATHHFLDDGLWFGGLQLLLHLLFH